MQFWLLATYWPSGSGRESQGSMDVSSHAWSGDRYVGLRLVNWQDKLRTPSVDLVLWTTKSVISEHEIGSFRGRLSLVVQVAKPGWVFLWQMAEEMQVGDMDECIFLSAELLAEVH